MKISFSLQPCVLSLLCVVKKAAVESPTSLPHSLHSSHSPPPYDRVVTKIEYEDGVCDKPAQLQVNQLPQGSCLEDKLSEAAWLKRHVGLH